LLRSYVQQFRRGIDKDQRAMYVRLGYANSTVVITQGMQASLIKYIPLGGLHLDEALARHLKISVDEAATLRRHNGDRRADQQDPEIARSIQEATRPVVERLVNELALCIRYHRVAFRGQSLVRLIFGGVEAASSLVERIGARLDAKCELS